MTTHELFQEYFATHPMPERLQRHIERDELYETEKKLGKAFIDFSVDDVIEYLNTIKIHGGGLYYSYGSLSTSYRSIFDWYAETYKPIYNPWRSKRLKGQEAYKLLGDEIHMPTAEDMEAAIESMRSKYDERRSDFVELLVRLFYDGFANAQEVTTLKEEQIDFEQGTVTFPTRKIHISPRTMELLKINHAAKDMPGSRQDFVMTPWRGGYIKWPIYAKQVPAFDDRAQTQVANTIARNLSVFFTDGEEINLNFRTLGYLGFYTYITKRFGREKVDEVLRKTRTNGQFILDAAKDYGFQVSIVANVDMSDMRKALLPFTKAD